MKKKEMFYRHLSERIVRFQLLYTRCCYNCLKCCFRPFIAIIIYVLVVIKPYQRILGNSMSPIWPMTSTVTFCLKPWWIQFPVMRPPIGWNEFPTIFWSDKVCSKRSPFDTKHRVYQWINSNTVMHNLDPVSLHKISITVLFKQQNATSLTTISRIERLKLKS